MLTAWIIISLIAIVGGTMSNGIEGFFAGLLISFVMAIVLGVAALIWSVDDHDCWDGDLATSCDGSSVIGR